MKDRKHGLRRARMAAKTQGLPPPPKGKAARLAMAVPPPERYVYRLGGAKPVAPDTTEGSAVNGVPSAQAAVPVPANEPLIGPLAGGADTPIEDLDLPQITYSTLKMLGLNTIGDINARQEKIPGIGKKRRDAIVTRMPVGFTCNFPAA